MHWCDILCLFCHVTSKLILAFKNKTDWMNVPVDNRINWMNGYNPQRITIRHDLNFEGSYGSSTHPGRNANLTHLN
jgi:hypothetical protein